MFFENPVLKIHRKLLEKYPQQSPYLAYLQAVKLANMLNTVFPVIIWFIDNENLFHSYFERKNDKFLIFNIVYLLNFERKASLKKAPH